MQVAVFVCLTRKTLENSAEGCGRTRRNSEAATSVAARVHD